MSACHRMVRWCLVAALVLGPGAAVFAQAPDEVPPGDVITLTNGSQMSGVRVLRRTATKYRIEVVEGVVMDIPASQVSHVEYDDSIRSRSGEFARGGAREGDNDEIWAQEMAPSLNKVLTQPLDQPLSLPEQDLIAVMQALSDQFGITIEVHEVVHGMEAGERRWSVEVPEEATLLRLFRDELPARFPNLVALTQFDRILITTRTEADPSDALSLPGVPGDEAEEEAP